MNAQDLKNSILQLAIQGKLVEQRKEEGTAKELLEQIQAEKEQLIKDKKIKKENPLQEITEDEIPFDIPESWKWIRFGDLGSYKKGPFGSALTKGIFVPKGNETVKVYEQKNAIQKNVELGDYYITREYFDSKMKGFELFPGDIIVSCAGTIGETYVMPEQFEQGIINQALMRMKIMPQIYVDYFLLYFDFILKKTARQSSKGSAIKNIPPFEELKSYLVPIPPLEEQKRIVAKIEELLPYVEQYGEAHSKLEVFNKKFPEDMNKSILQYAIQGKLVEQRPEEGIAEELYQQIQEEKAKLIKAGKIKKDKPLPEISEDEITFEIPDSWKWVRLGNISEKMNDGVHFAPNYLPSGIPCFSAKDIYNNKINLDKCNYISCDDFASMKEKINIKEGSVLITKSGSIGRSTIVTEIFDFGLVESIGVVNPICVYPPYIKVLLDYVFCNGFINEYTQGIGVKHLTLTLLSSIKFPLPPLSEQKRIVAKIEELLPYCQQLVK